MEKLHFIYKGGITVAGAASSYLWGGWNTMLSTLLAFVVIDYFTGIAASAKEGKLSSRIGFKAIPKKIMIFVMVTVGHLIDGAIGEGHIFRDATIFFYLSNELLSIIENAGRMNVPIPDVIKKAVEVLKGRGKQ